MVSRTVAHRAWMQRGCISHTSCQKGNVYFGHENWQPKLCKQSVQCIVVHLANNVVSLFHAMNSPAPWNTVPHSTFKCSRKGKLTRSVCRHLVDPSSVSANWSCLLVIQVRGGEVFTTNGWMELPGCRSDPSLQYRVFSELSSRVPLPRQSCWIFHRHMIPLCCDIIYKCSVWGV